MRSKWQSLPTEAINSSSLGIDKLSPGDIVDLMVGEDRKMLSAVQRERERIAVGIEMVASALRKGGRIVFIGAGTSGRSRRRAWPTRSGRRSRGNRGSWSRAASGTGPPAFGIGTSPGFTSGATAAAVWATRRAPRSAPRSSTAARGRSVSISSATAISSTPRARFGQRPTRVCRY